MNLNIIIVFAYCQVNQLGLCFRTLVYLLNKYDSMYHISYEKYLIYDSGEYVLHVQYSVHIVRTETKYKICIYVSSSR